MGCLPGCGWSAGLWWWEPQGRVVGRDAVKDYGVTIYSHGVVFHGDGRGKPKPTHAEDDVPNVRVGERRRGAISAMSVSSKPTASGPSKRCYCVRGGLKVEMRPGNQGEDSEGDRFGGQSGIGTKRAKWEDCRHRRNAGEVWRSWVGMGDS